MKTPLTSTCRHCRHYLPEGRRGGLCQQLGVSVQGQWKACSLAVSPFGSAWEKIEELSLWQEGKVAFPSPAVTAADRHTPCQLLGTTFTEKSVPTVSV